MTTLAVDIGGTSIKLVVLGENGKPVSDTKRRETPSPADPEVVLPLIRDMAGSLPPQQRVSVGFPGVVKDGVAQNAPNLGNELWRGVSVRDRLTELLERPVRVLNDADLQGLGVVHGAGVEMVVTLGTGMGTALFTDGRLVPNLELGHHPFRDGKTYEDLVRDSELKRIGAERWTARVLDAIAQLEPIFNYDTLHLGGGNTRHLKADLPDNVRLFSLGEALAGALALWDAD
ncbi:MAG: chromosome partitioning protein ParA [Myxococcales bacterium SG8_38]|nr:MAG: chromosome partitioning protein ParA [Myxococcales bacterium SG8_38]